MTSVRRAALLAPLARSGALLGEHLVRELPQLHARQHQPHHNFPVPVLPFSHHHGQVDPDVRAGRLDLDVLHEKLAVARVDGRQRGCEFGALAQGGSPLVFRREARSFAGCNDDLSCGGTEFLNGGRGLGAGCTTASETQGSAA